MNPLSLILGFLPLIAFSALAGRPSSNGIAVAAAVAVLIALVTMAFDRPMWPPKLVNLLQALLFLVVAVVGFVAGDDVDNWLFDWAGGLVTVVLGVLIVLLVPAMPFTEQYARASVPQEYWATPTFKKINRVLSLAWGVAIGVMGLASLAVAALRGRADSFVDANTVDLVLNWGVPIAAIWFMVHFTSTYPDRVRASVGGAAATTTP